MRDVAVNTCVVGPATKGHLSGPGSSKTIVVWSIIPNIIEFHHASLINTLPGYACTRLGARYYVIQYTRRSKIRTKYNVNVSTGLSAALEARIIKDNCIIA